MDDPVELNLPPSPSEAGDVALGPFCMAGVHNFAQHLDKFRLLDESDQELTEALTHLATRPKTPTVIQEAALEVVSYLLNVVTQQPPE